MPDVREFQKVVESAEQAAAAGDIAAAEALLREAAELQEASHGPLHPDLASTFNNLAVVCEMAHKPIDAEQFYRRAYAIASGSLSPGHAMVATARDNLRDFCVARGLPTEEWMDMRTGAHIAPPAPAQVTAAPSAARAAAAVPPPAMPTAPTPRAPGAGRGLGVGVAVAMVAVLAVLAIARVSRTPSSGDATPPNADTSAAPPALDPAHEIAQVPAPVASAPAPVTAAPITTAPAAPAAVREVAPPPPAVPAAAPAPPTTASSDSPATPAGVRVVTASVCAALTTGDAWRCTPAGATPVPGRLSYYTRVASPRGLRVRHRWYQGDRLRQDVALNIGANAADGYRTFSRQSVAPGEWRVELRAENGAVLDEARFVVR